MQKKILQSRLAPVLAAVMLFSHRPVQKEPALWRLLPMTAAESTTSYEQYLRQMGELKSQAEFDAFTEKIFREHFRLIPLICTIRWPIRPPMALRIMKSLFRFLYDTAEQNESLGNTPRITRRSSRLSI